MCYFLTLSTIVFVGLLWLITSSVLTAPLNCNGHNRNRTPTVYTTGKSFSLFRALPKLKQLVRTQQQLVRSLFPQTLSIKFFKSRTISCIWPLWLKWPNLLQKYYLILLQTCEVTPVSFYLQFPWLISSLKSMCLSYVVMVCHLMVLRSQIETCLYQSLFLNMHLAVFICNIQVWLNLHNLIPI